VVSGPARCWRNAGAFWQHLLPVVGRRRRIERSLETFPHWPMQFRLGSLERFTNIQAVVWPKFFDIDNLLKNCRIA
jgi:hypothetical protein